MPLLFEHQITGAEKLVEIAHRHGNALLRDEPGLGKTRTLIKAAMDLSAPGDIIRVFCPAVVIPHWEDEITVLDPHETRDWGVSSYAKTDANYRAPSVLILDEIHYLRNPLAQRTKNLLGKTGLAKRAMHVLGASGTIMWKSPDDCWTFLYALFPKVLVKHKLYNRRIWRERFVDGYETKWGFKAKDVKNEPEFRAFLSEIGIRRTLADVGMDVPPVFFTTRRIPGDSSAVHAACQAMGITDVSQLKDGDEHLATLRRVIGEAKVDAVRDVLLDDLEGSVDKLVVFAYHYGVIETLHEDLETLGYEVARITGETSPAAREDAIERFQFGTARVFLGQIDACSTGITLTAAHRAYIVEPSWSATVNYQAAKRIARIGQTADHCVVTMLALAGTIDEAIVAQHWRELQMQAAVDGAADI